MGRKRLKPKLKRSSITYVKLRPEERWLLDRLHRSMGRTRSDILRDAFLLYIAQLQRNVK